MENISEESIEISGSIDVQIFFEDTDFSGVVYHANYLKYFDRARELIIGIDRLKQLQELGFNYVVAQASVKYIKPLRFGDRIQVRAKTSITRSPKNVYAHEIFRGEELIAVGEVTTVAIGPDLRPRRYTDEVFQQLRPR